ncbi:MAG: SAM-dependent methyltransferase [Dehalococcoidia bacterium]
MQVSRARFLVSRAGREALGGLPGDIAGLTAHRLAEDLRRSFAPEDAAALGEQITLRAKASERWGADHGFLYSAEGLEMMTHPLVAERRALRLASLGLPVADLTCGLGGDLRAILGTGTGASGIERDEATALLASANVTGRVARGDATRPPVDLSTVAILLDPTRRSGVSRRFDPAAFSPPWDVTLELARAARAGVVKGPPGIDLKHVPPAAEVEFVQLGRSLRECALWLGEGSASGLRRAVLLGGGALDSTAPEAAAECAEPGPFIFDPESCVTRAGLVRHLAHVLGAQLMDPQVAYLTGPRPEIHPMAATFEVLEALPFSLSRLKARLRERSWRPDEVRRRAFPVEPDELRRLLGRLEGERVALLCTTIAGRRTVFVARRVMAPGRIA